MQEQLLKNPFLTDDGGVETGWLGIAGSLQILRFNGKTLTPQ